MSMEAKKIMEPKEIEELIRLRCGGSIARLAGELNMTEMGVRRWLDGSRTAKGPSAILLRQWLEEARRKAKTTPSRAS